MKKIFMLSCVLGAAVCSEDILNNNQTSSGYVQETCEPFEHAQVEQDSSEMQNCLYFHVGAKDNVSPDETKENLKKLFDSITLDRLGLSDQN